MHRSRATQRYKVKVTKPPTLQYLRFRDGLGFRVQGLGFRVGVAPLRLIQYSLSPLRVCTFLVEEMSRIPRNLGLKDDPCSNTVYIRFMKKLGPKKEENMVFSTHLM